MSLRSYQARSDRLRRTYVTILFASFLLVVQTGFSEPQPPAAKIITKYGLHFPLARYQSTGSGQALVSVGNGAGASEELVLETRLSTYVANEYFSNRALFETLPVQEVLQFIAQALENKDPTAAKDAAIALISYGDAGNPQTLSFIDALPVGEQETGFLKELLLAVAPSTDGSGASLSGSVPPALFGRLIERIGLQDLPWIREHVPTLIFTHAQSVRAAIRECMFTALRAQKLSDARALQSLQQELFGVDDPEVKSFAVLFGKLASIVADDNFVENVTDIADRDPDLRKYFGPLFLDSIHNRAAQLLTDNQPEKALGLLAHIDRTRRTPRTHELIIKSFEQLSSAAALSLFTEKKDILDFVLFVSDKDPDIRQSYIDYLERSIMAAKDSSGETMNGLFGLINQIRPDPNVQNDTLRISLATYFRKNGQSDKANILLNQTKTSIGIASQLSLLAAFLQGVNLIALVLILVIVFSAILFFLVAKSWIASSRRRAIQDSDQHADSTIGEEEPADISGRPVFVTARISSGNTTAAAASGVGLSNNGLPLEYANLMHEFGLSPHSSLKEIKAEFRTKMKGVHPDRQQDHDETPEEFIRLKQIYERILDFRKRLGLDV